MRTIHSDSHLLRAAKTELCGGLLVPPFECPERVLHILARIEVVGLGPVEPSVAHGLAPVRRVHDPDFLDFLATAWDRWTAAGHAGEAIPTGRPPLRRRGPSTGRWGSGRWRGRPRSRPAPGRPRRPRPMSR